MTPSRRTFLKGAGAAAALAAVGDARGLSRVMAAGKVPITFWCAPFVNGQDTKVFLPWFLKNDTLPDLSFTNNYGDGSYSDQQSKFLIQAKTGTPDILEGLWENMVAYVRAGILSPLTSEFTAWADHSKFFPSTVAALSYNGEQYGVPYNVNARGMLVRKSILKHYGLKIPTTWAELLETASYITTKGATTSSYGPVLNMSGFGLCTNVASVRGPQEWISFFFQLNKHMFKLDAASKKWKLNTTPAEIAKVYQLYHDLFYATSKKNANPAIDNQYKGIDYSFLDAGYVTGKYAMVPEGPWMLSYGAYGGGPGSISKYIIEQDTAIVPLPVAPGGGSGTYLEVKPLLLNKFSKNQAQGWEAIQFLASKKILGKWSADSGFIAPRTDAQASDWWHKDFGALVPSGVALDPLNWTAVFDSIFKVLQTVVYGQATPAAAGTALYNKLNQLLAQGVL
jgi:ABC-type glycerol-3-phosphate transport system substrate-binding protein